MPLESAWRPSPLSPLRVGLLAAALLVPAAQAPAELFVWVDEEGHTHVSDDPARAPQGRSAAEADPGLWQDGLRGPRWPARAGVGREEARVQRLLRGAVDDLRRGETGRAAAALEGVLRSQPARPEAHWYLALLDRQRGRWDASEAHLRAFLAHAGAAFEPWRESALRRLRVLEDERRLARAQAAQGPLRFVALESPHFRIRYDERLGDASPDFARTVVRYLEEARQLVATRLGVAPQESTRVVLYGKAAYLAAHRHRFSFPTVGFFDGRIHVVSAAHPAGELRALLFHEFTHAVFRDRAGSDRPYWLNEGLAELAERASRRQDALTRSERVTLRRRIRAGGWIPLWNLADGFGGLDEGQARVAYLEATAAVRWLEARTDVARRAALLADLGAGRSIDAALRRAVGLDTRDLDAAVRRSVLEEFPAAAD